MVNEKRREQRRREENKVSLELFAEEKNSRKNVSVNALTHDISLSGARLLCDATFPVGTPMKIQITLSRTHKLVNLEGKVRWVKDVQDGELFEMGVEFIHTLPNKVMVLLQHLFGK
jgi:PilZ domain-containing protein